MTEKTAGGEALKWISSKLVHLDLGLVAAAIGSSNAQKAPTLALYGNGLGQLKLMVDNAPAYMKGANADATPQKRRSLWAAVGGSSVKSAHDPADAGAAAARAALLVQPARHVRSPLLSPLLSSPLSPLLLVRLSSRVCVCVHFVPFKTDAVPLIKHAHTVERVSVVRRLYSYDGGII